MSYPTIAIIGGGFSGLGSAIQLKKKLGLDAEIFEATNDIGGTWSYNTYPGCASDIPSHLYSFSFELNPKWSQNYGPQKEILEYLHMVAKKYHIYEKVQFETTVVRATWIEEQKKWELELNQASQEKNQIRYFDFIFSGIGSLRIPNVPKQFEAFQGKIVHSAAWDHDYDFNNKRVAVIGSGTSSIQIVPNLIKSVDHLYSFQRTPSWVAPKNIRPYSNLIINIFTYVPFVMLLYRAYLFFTREFNFTQWADAESKSAKKAKLSNANHMKQVLASNGREDLIPKLIPDFPVGCKRFGVSDEYLQALCLPKATVNRLPITNIQGRTITTADGVETEVDTLVLATGYNVIGFLGDMKVYGRGGISLNNLWEQEAPKTYKTVSIHGFPNFFMLLGPGSILGHNSVVTMIESQVNYGIEMVGYMMKNGIKSMDPTEKAQEVFSSDMKSRFKGTVWTAGCRSWYMTKDGEIHSLWPQSVMKFISMLKKNDFESDFIRAQ